MKALAYLLGMQALNAAHTTTRAWPSRPAADEHLGPLASTPETAAAWRAWAEAGRMSSAQAARAGQAPLTAPPAPSLTTRRASGGAHV